jgi:hypothetical protein
MLIAVAAGLSGDTPKEMYLAQAETEEEGEGMFQLACARKQAFSNDGPSEL